MIHFVDISMDKLKAMPLKERLVTKMLSEMTEYYFANGAIDILVKRNPNYRSNPNDKCQIDGMLEIKEAAFNAYWALHVIYESEYGKLSDDADNIITEAAKDFAEKALEFRGWKESKTSVKKARTNALNDIVICPNGKHVYIDSCFTINHGYETMVFPCDENGKVTDWGDIDASWYSTYEEMQTGHTTIVEKWKGESSCI